MRCSHVEAIRLWVHPVWMRISIWEDSANEDNAVNVRNDEAPSSQTQCYCSHLRQKWGRTNAVTTGSQPCMRCKPYHCLRSLCRILWCFNLSHAITAKATQHHNPAVSENKFIVLTCTWNVYVKQILWIPPFLCTSWSNFIVEIIFWAFDPKATFPYSRLPLRFLQNFMAISLRESFSMHPLHFHVHIRLKNNGPCREFFRMRLHLSPQIKERRCSLGHLMGNGDRRRCGQGDKATPDHF